MFDYASIKSLAEDMATSAMLLSGSSVALLFSALSELENRFAWYGSGEYPDTTDAEWDDIQAMLSLAVREIMQSGITGTFAYVAKVPAGALLCDGTVYQRVDYPTLYDTWIGTALVLDDDTFQVPNIRDRVIVGTSINHPLLSSGGAETHVLSESEMPIHSHVIGGSTTGLVVAPGELPVMMPVALPTATGNTGGSQAHNNMQPYISLLAVVWT